MAFSVEIDIEVDVSKLNDIANRAAAFDSMLVFGAVTHISKAARAIVPVDTGALRASIQKSADGSEGEVQAKAGYALFVELGTRKMSARPYLIPALESTPWRHLIRESFRAIGL